MAGWLRLNGTFNTISVISRLTEVLEMPLFIARYCPGQHTTNTMQQGH